MFYLASVELPADVNYRTGTNEVRGYLYRHRQVVPVNSGCWLWARVMFSSSANMFLRRILGTITMSQSGHQLHVERAGDGFTVDSQPLFCDYRKPSISCEPDLLLSLCEILYIV